MSPLLFCISLNPISRALSATGLGYKCGPSPHWAIVSHLYYMDDLKLLASNDKQLTEMTNVVETISSSIGMSFNPAKCNWLCIRRGTVHAGGQLKTLQDSVIEHLDPGAYYRYLGVPESSHFEAETMRVRLRAEYRRRLELVCCTGLHARNLAKAINTFAIPVILYTLPILGWTKAEIAALDRVTRTTLTSHHAHHPKASAIRVHLPRQDGGRGILSFRHLLDRALVRIASYLASRPEVVLLQAVVQHHELAVAPTKSITRRAAGVRAELELPALELCTRERVKRAIADRDLALLKDKPLHGQFWKRASDAGLDMALTFAWLQSPTIRPATEGLLIAVQDQVVATRHRQVAIFGATEVRDSCRLCGAEKETTDHIIACCPVLAKSSYIERHNSVVRIVHWTLCQQYGLGAPLCALRQHQLQHVIQDATGETRLLWEVGIPTDRHVPSNRPDLVLRAADRVLLIDISVPLDTNVNQKMQEKIVKYAPLQRELQRIWSVQDIQVVPVVVGALGGLTRDSVQHATTLCGSLGRVKQLQQSAVLGTLAIVRSVLAIRD